MILLNAQLPDPREAGMKAYNLSLLISNTFNVPAAVVLPKDYFACDEAELNRRLTELTQQLMQLLPSADGWAVRSSAADEDGITGAQAGKYRTRRIAHPDELPDAAVEVHEGGVPVILQRFIEPDYAGILFTCNPLTGEEDLHIELVQGRGEQLAGGCLNPLYTYSNGSWSKPTDVPEKLLHQLKSDAATAAVLFKHHVDMEFCIKDGVLYWLQVRPVTAIPDSCDDSTGLDEGWFLLDQCTEPVTPLVRELDPGGFFQMPYWDTRFVRHYPYVRLKQAPAADTAALSSPDWQTLRSRFEPEFDRQLQEDLTVYTLQELWELAAERIKQNRAYVAAYLDRGWLKERRVTGEKLKEIISRYIGDNADVQLVLSSLTEGLNTLTYQKNAELHQLICAAGGYPDFNELSAAVLTGASHPWGGQFNAFIHKYGYELPHPLALHLNTLAESTGDLLARIRAESVKLNGREKVQRPLSRESAAAELEQQMDTAEKSAFRQLLQAYRLYILRTEDDDYYCKKALLPSEMLW